MKLDALLELIDTDGLPPPGSEAVTAFEASTGLHLPDDYRAFLAATPGGWIRVNVTFELVGELGPDEEGQEILGRVAGLRTDDSVCLEERVRTGAQDGVPVGLLSIMTDRGGNTIAMALRSDRFGEMFFLDHEVAADETPTLEEAEADDWGYAIPFAPSFTAFIEGLRLAKD